MRNYLCLCLYAMLLGGCASNILPSTNYMDEDGTTVSVAGSDPTRNPNIVRVVHTEQFSNVLVVNREPGTLPNAHPLQITKDELIKLLASINFRRKAGDKAESLFSDDDLKELAPWLVKALSTATPDQEVVFSYPQAQGIGLFSLKFMTTARVFYRDGHLNLIFGSILGSYEGEYLQTGHFRPLPVGSRFKTTEEERQLVSDSQVLSGAPGRFDWISIAIAAQSPASQPQANATLPSQSVLPPASIEERLSAAKKLHDKGLISDQEFNDKRKQILDGL